MSVLFAPAGPTDGEPWRGEWRSARAAAEPFPFAVSPASPARTAAPASRTAVRQRTEAGAALAGLLKRSLLRRRRARRGIRYDGARWRGRVAYAALAAHALPAHEVVERHAQRRIRRVGADGRAVPERVVAFEACLIVHRSRRPAAEEFRRDSAAVGVPVRRVRGRRPEDGRLVAELDRFRLLHRYRAVHAETRGRIAGVGGAGITVVAVHGHVQARSGVRVALVERAEIAVVAGQRGALAHER